jgi:hypothetical protein
MIVGQGFMAKYRVDLLYSKQSCLLRKGHRRITVQQRSAYRDRPVSESKSDALLSALQVKRLMRKGNSAFLAVVTEVEDISTASTPGDDWVS